MRLIGIGAGAHPRDHLTMIVDELALPGQECPAAHRGLFRRAGAQRPAPPGDALASDHRAQEAISRSVAKNPLVRGAGPGSALLIGLLAGWASRESSSKSGGSPGDHMAGMDQV